LLLELPYGLVSSWLLTSHTFVVLPMSMSMPGVPVRAHNLCPCPVSMPCVHALCPCRCPCPVSMLHCPCPCPVSKPRVPAPCSCPVFLPRVPAPCLCLVSLPLARVSVPCPYGVPAPCPWPVSLARVSTPFPCPDIVIFDANYQKCIKTGKLASC
jgi:hypothetical protein